MFKRVRQDMRVELFAEHLLFAVFNANAANFGWQYFTNSAELYEKYFDYGKIYKCLGSVGDSFERKHYYNKHKMWNSENSFNEFTSYAYELYPERQELLQRLVFFAYVGHHFVQHGFSGARVWVFKKICTEIHEHDPSLAMLRGKSVK